MRNQGGAITYMWYIAAQTELCLLPSYAAGCVSQI